MTIYDCFGIKTIINVAGTRTSLGGALMDVGALNAMNEAALYSVEMFDIQAAACRVISKKTHAEAGIVTCGAFSSLTLAAAACMCRFDVHMMNLLPDTSKIPNEFIMVTQQISGYTRGITFAGGKIVPAGIPLDTPPPEEVANISVGNLEAEINKNTAGIVYAIRNGSKPPLSEIVTLSRNYNVPIIVDAAAQVPPFENLYRFIDDGVDLVCFSGGKGIRGPQNSGILCGNKELICSAIGQMLDMGIGSFDDWQPPKEFSLLKEKLRYLPTHGIGRGAKVSKESIIGLLVALENLDTTKFKERATHLKCLLNKISVAIESIEGVETQMTEEYEAYPMLMIKINEYKLGKTARDVVLELRANGIYTRDNHLNHGIFYIHSLNLDEKVTNILKEKLVCILKVNA